MSEEPNHIQYTTCIAHTERAGAMVPIVCIEYRCKCGSVRWRAMRAVGGDHIHLACANCAEDYCSEEIVRHAADQDATAYGTRQ